MLRTRHSHASTLRWRAGWSLSTNESRHPPEESHDAAGTPLWPSGSFCGKGTQGAPARESAAEDQCEARAPDRLETPHTLSAASRTAGSLRLNSACRFDWEARSECGAQCTSSDVLACPAAVSLTNTTSTSSSEDTLPTAAAAVAIAGSGSDIGFSGQAWHDQLTLRCSCRPRDALWQVASLGQPSRSSGAGGGGWHGRMAGADHQINLSQSCGELRSA